jgi:hypothetical protein
MAQFGAPDMILREGEMPGYLAALARQVGYAKPPAPPKVDRQEPFGLADIYDDRIEALAQTVYQRDYVLFGFGAWR